MSRIRLVPMILILLISLAVLFTGWQAYRHFNLVNPLETQLSSVTGVKNVDVAVGNPTVVHVKLGQVADLQSTYRSISQTLSGSVKSSGDIIIEDNRNQALSDAWEQLNPMVYEGAAHGNFTEMISNVKKSAKQDGIDAKITMDAHHLYVQFEQGSHYLYEVLPYSQSQGGAAS